MGAVKTEPAEDAPGTPRAPIFQPTEVDGWRGAPVLMSTTSTKRTLP